MGQFGVILHWNGSAWTEDPQSIKITSSQLNAVAFGAVGRRVGRGRKRHDPALRRPEMERRKASGGGLRPQHHVGRRRGLGSLRRRERQPDHARFGGWQDGGRSLLPSDPASPRATCAWSPDCPTEASSLRGARSCSSAKRRARPSAYAAQPLQGIAVALAPYRGADGKLRTYVSVAPPAGGKPVARSRRLSRRRRRAAAPDRQRVAGSEPRPVRRRPSNRRRRNQERSRCSRSQRALTANTPGRSAAMTAPKTQPGREPWEQRRRAVPPGWQTASIWRYDTAGSAASGRARAHAPSLPAQQGTVSFAFFTSPMCRTRAPAYPMRSPT